MRALEKVFLGTIARESLLPAGSHITAAVSGGADSVAMLYLLCRFADARDWHVDVLHINHRLRAASDEDESFVRNLAGQLDVPARFVSPEPDTKGSMESRWSSIRQSIYMEQPGIVAVAHTASDRAETILMRLFEGAGLRGLGGMDYHGVEPVQRPILDMHSTEIRNWLKEKGHHWVEDFSNRDMVMSRNRLRLEVMPALEEQFPEAVSGICRSGALLSHWRDLQDQLSGLTGGDSVSREELLEVPGVLGALMLWQMAGKPRNGFDEFQKILDWIRRGGRGKHILPGGKRLVAEDELVRVESGGPGRF
ncbi:MAG: tRNA lysidine(34) synthetase TilS [Candidatus Sabulitectum sp.]|nr:tRNA lysidine(34) synthetase TilS [Candidatus Sabulitectum sp.]